MHPSGRHRVIEIGLVAIGADGVLEDQWTTLLQPDRDLGRTDIHGITGRHVAQAPRFEDVAGAVLDRIAGSVLVAHNARFDLAFLDAECARAGVILPPLAHLCTLSLTRLLDVDVERARLADCCARFGVPVHATHTALADARACAGLLVAYLQLARGLGLRSLDDLGCTEPVPKGAWPRMMARRPALPRPVGPEAPRERSYVASLVQKMPMPASAIDPDVDAYLEVLDLALEDRRITSIEVDELAALARTMNLGVQQLAKAHQEYLVGLVRAARADGLVTDMERADLEAVAELLGVADLEALLSAGSTAPEPVEPRRATEDLRGMSVCFTGALQCRCQGQPISRERAHKLAEEAGLRVSQTVTQAVDILVVADPESRSSKAERARRYGVRVMVEPIFWNKIGVEVEGGSALVPLGGPGHTEEVMRPAPIQEPSEDPPARESAATGAAHGEPVVRDVVESRAQGSAEPANSPTKAPGENVGSEEEIDRATTERVRVRLEDWRRRLIDLSGRNRLIKFPPTRHGALPIESPSVRELLADLERRAPWPIYLAEEPEQGPRRPAIASPGAQPDPSPILRDPKPGEIITRERDPKVIRKTLERLARRSTSELEDKAVRVLYLAAGFLDWYDVARSEAVSSPLVLVPVELKRASARKPYELFLAEDEDIVINPALTIKLERDVGLEIPGDWGWEDKPIAEELDEIRQAVASRGWEVREDAVLGIFSFHKLVMYRDLLANEEQVMGHAVVRAFATGSREALAPESGRLGASVPRAEELDEIQDPETTYSILDADATQRRCIEAAKRNVSFVMQGPPGTGKSQTIANVIAESIGQGKRVLFISEKAAALDVVFNRLAARGLSDFCLKLHGDGAKRREVVSELATSLTSETVPRRAPSPDELGRLADLRRRLNLFVELLHTPSPELLDRSPREVYATLAGLEDAPAPGGAPRSNQGSSEALIEQLRDGEHQFGRLAGDPWRVACEADFPWRGFDEGHLDAELRAAATSEVAEVRAGVAALRDSSDLVSDALGITRPWTHIEARELIDLLRHLEAAPDIDAEWLSAGRPRETADTVEQARTAHFARFASLEQLRKRAPETDPSALPADLQSTVGLAVQALSGQIGRTDAWESDLLAQLPGLASALRGVVAQIDSLAGSLEDVGSMLGQPVRGASVADVDRVVALARLAFTAEARPDASWLGKAGLERAQGTLDEVGPLLRDYSARRGQILEQYDPAVFELEADAMADRFEQVHVGAFARLKGAYRRDAKALKGTRSDSHGPSQSTVADLREVAEVARLGDHLDAESARMSRAFGSLSRGRETEPAVIAAAIATATQARQLVSPDARLEVLASRLCTGAEDDPALNLASDRLEAEVEAVRRVVSHLAPFNGGGVALGEEVSLDKLRVALDRVRPAVERLLRLAEPLLLASVGGAPTLSDLEHWAKEVTTVHDLSSQIAASAPVWERALGVQYQGNDSDWARMASHADWIQGLVSRVGDPIPLPIVERVPTAGGWPERSNLERHSTGLRTALERFASRFEAARAAMILEAGERGSLEELGRFCDLLRDRTDDLTHWTDYRAIRGRAANLGWGVFVDALARERVRSDQVLPAFHRAFWTRRLERLFELHEPLGEFRGHTHERLRREFQELDRRLVAGATERLIEQANANRPDAVVATGSEADLLLRENSKKRRHMPVRKLLGSLPELLPKLKPCLMMSPLSVSHFLTAEHRFDLVVFDEASQVPPEDAINCIYRGSQLIVAGDDKQLPPTAFFQRSEGEAEGYDEEAEGTEEVMDSVLEAAVPLMQEYSLRWHYRSRHENLIGFSNHHLYSNALVTFPSPEQESPRLGVSLTHVPDGVYDRGKSGTNRREAARVVERLVEYLLDGSGRSIGVIAFSVAQADAVRDELEQVRRDRPELESFFTGDRLRDVFVKNLEAVQGDERDVILFSVGYGKDKTGRFTMNLGPLNGENGHRRLNVAVTRARERVEVVTSVLAHEFSLAEEAPRGVRLLRDYLDFAERGPAALRAELGEMGGDFESPFEESVAAQLADLGHKAIPQVGVGGFRIDLGVVDPGAPGRFLLGIECDGATYHSTPTARDRDRLREEVLKGLGWSLHRIWSWDWVRDRPGEVRRLDEAVRAATGEARERRQEGGDGGSPAGDNAGASSRDASTDPESATLVERGLDEPGPVTGGASVDVGPSSGAVRGRRERPVHDLRDRDGHLGLPWTEPYERVELAPRSSYYEFHETSNRRMQAEMARQVIDAEAPVSIACVTQRLAEAYGVQARRRVVRAVREALGVVERAGNAEIHGDFVWRPDQRVERVRLPVPGDARSRRSIEDIPPEEIDLAIMHLRRVAGQVSDDGLLVQVGRLFGFDRTGDKIRSVLEERLAVVRSGEGWG